jgi:hypothetical protein
MDSGEIAHPPSRRRRRVTLLLLAVGLSIGSLGTGVLSLAVFTSTAVDGANAFTTGTVVIGASPVSALIGFTNMLPGNSVTAALTVSSSGTAALRYAMTTATTNADGKALKDQLVLTIRTQDTNTSGCGNFNGTQLYTGALSGALIGDPTQGAQAGDRTLAASTSEILCFQASLPASTGIAFQSAATTATFTFSAEQTANNP